jgi:type II secretory pathway pseudopilin PulG
MRAVRRDARGVTLAELVVTLGLFAIVMIGVIGTWGKSQEAYFIGSESAEVQQNVRAAIDFMVRELRSAGRDASVCAFDYTTGTTTDCDSGKVATCTTKMTGSGTPTWQTNNGIGGAGCTGVYAIPAASATATTIRIRSDRNHNGRIAGLGNAITSGGAADRAEEDVVYALSTTSCPPGVASCITRDDGTGPVAMVAVDINGLTFNYYPRPNFGPCAGVANPCDNAFTVPMTQAQADNIGRIRIVVQALQRTVGQDVSRTLVTEVALKNRL